MLFTLCAGAPLSSLSISKYCSSYCSLQDTIHVLPSPNPNLVQKVMSAQTYRTLLRTLVSLPDPQIQ